MGRIGKALRLKYNDIRAETDEVKFKVYDEIDHLYQAGKDVAIEEHKSGFPAITIDWGNSCPDRYYLFGEILE